MKKTTNFILTIILASTLVSPLLAEGRRNEHLETLRKERAEKAAAPDKSMFGQLKENAKAVWQEGVNITIEASVELVVNDPTLFQSFPVEVRKLMIEQHPDVMIGLICQHPGLIRQVPARKIAKDILYALWYS